MRDVDCSPETAPVEPTSAHAFDPHAPHLQRWASLLEWFYLRAGRELPHIELLRPAEVPEPFHALLVHSADMTPTLESFFRQPLGLQVLGSEVDGELYRREVVLTLGCEARRILYGAIRIQLPHLPPGVRRRVLEERQPLGHILQTEGTPHLSWPQTFFRAEPDPHMMRVLAIPALQSAGLPLYGRRNVLLDGSRRLLAEVIEVLGPVAQVKGKANGAPAKSPRL